MANYRRKFNKEIKGHKLPDSYQTLVLKSANDIFDELEGKIEDITNKLGALRISRVEALPEAYEIAKQLSNDLY